MKNNETRRTANWTKQMWLAGIKISASTYHRYDDIVQETKASFANALKYANEKY